MLNYANTGMQVIQAVVPNHITSQNYNAAAAGKAGSLCFMGALLLQSTIVLSIFKKQKDTNNNKM
jgi:hypothetical protein